MMSHRFIGSDAAVEVLVPLKALRVGRSLWVALYMSREYRGRRIVVWPVYIDSTASRGEGRKISLRDAVRKPRVEEIVEAAKRLGLNPEVEEARYPRSWWENTRRVIVDKMGSKSATLKALATELRKLREEKRRLRHA